MTGHVLPHLSNTLQLCSVKTPIETKDHFLQKRLFFSSSFGLSNVVTIGKGQKQLKDKTHNITAYADANSVFTASEKRNGHLPDTEVLRSTEQLWLGRAPLVQAPAQSRVSQSRLGFEYRQKRRLQSFSGQPCLLLSHIHSKKFS